MKKVIAILALLLLMSSSVSAWDDFNYWWNRPVNSPQDLYTVSRNIWDANNGQNGPFYLDFWAPQRSFTTMYWWL